MDKIIVEGTNELLQEHLKITEPQQFKLLGTEWDLLPGVYSPSLTRCAALYAEWVPFPIGGTFCEVGCGTGYISVIAALQGSSQVVALDINESAVDNTRLNIARHGVEHIVQARFSDIFSGLDNDEKFDVIFWNSSFIETSSETANPSALESAFFDPGYQSHSRFLREASRYLHNGGQLYLGFADVGNLDHLLSLATECGWLPVLARACTCESLLGTIQYQLIRFDQAP